MFNRIIVPVDGSDRSWRAVPVADRLAAECAAELELVQVVALPAEVGLVSEQLHRRARSASWRTSEPIVSTLVSTRSVASTIADYATTINGGMVVMSSTGRGRSEAVLGSVTADLLTLTFGPLIVVGPDVDVEREAYADELLVAVDGSTMSETALGLAGAWGIGLGARPWVVTVIEPDARRPPDTFEGNYVARLAHHVTARTHRDTEFEVLHGEHPSRAIVDYARTIDARLIVAATHGRTGLARLALGSVAAGIVRHAPCPVVLLRPPALIVGQPQHLAASGAMAAHQR